MELHLNERELRVSPFLSFFSLSFLLSFLRKEIRYCRSRCSIFLNWIFNEINFVAESVRQLLTIGSLVFHFHELNYKVWRGGLHLIISAFFSPPPGRTSAPRFHGQVSNCIIKRSIVGAGFRRIFNGAPCVFCFTHDLDIETISADPW